MHLIVELNHHVMLRSRIQDEAVFSLLKQQVVALCFHGNGFLLQHGVLYFLKQTGVEMEYIELLVHADQGLILSGCRKEVDIPGIDLLLQHLYLLGLGTEVSAILVFHLQIVYIGYDIGKATGESTNGGKRSMMDATLRIYKIVLSTHDATQENIAIAQPSFIGNQLVVGIDDYLALAIDV